MLVVAGALLLGWVMFYQPQPQTAAVPQPPQNVQTVQTPPAAVAVPDVPPVAVPAVPQQAEAAKTAVAQTVQAVIQPMPPVDLKNSKVIYQIAPVSGTILRVTPVGYAESAGAEKDLDIVPAANGQRTFAASLFSGTLLKRPEVVQEKNTVKITREIPGIRLIQTFTLKDDSYVLDMAYTLVNTTGTERLIPELVIWTSGLPPMQALSGDKVNSIRHNVDYCLAPKGKVESFSPDADEPEDLKKEETSSPLYWLGSTNKYFASLLFMGDGAEFNGGLKLEPAVINVKGTKFAQPSVGGAIKNILIPAGTAKTYSFQYYCGPKEIEEIKTLPESAMDAMHIAYWSWFEFIARPLAQFLVLLYDLVGNYGLAIILLTIIVRLIFWPVTQKANNSMRKMQKIQPQMKALREKYKSNPQELNMRMMELYKQEKVNPLGGCLPMLLQLPIFFALYSVFDSAVELRHVSFLWAKDLAQPDQVGPVLNFLGFDLALHPWIIMMTILMVVQQKMTPTQGDPAQQKIMMAMPIIMLVMLYWLPSGLTLYWTVSQLFSIIQLKYGQYIAAKEEAKEKSPRAAAKK